MFGVFGKLFCFGVKAAWGISKFVLTIVFLPLIEHNHYVKKGDLIGEVVDPFEGTVKQQIRTERGGLLFTLRAYPVVYEGDLLARILTE